ncbi:MAG: hypothetical protein O3B22_10120 [Proteobacteria bacterium]|nr:hypothetical protein [Pseudomonadota bacterium]
MRKRLALSVLVALLATPMLLSGIDAASMAEAERENPLLGNWYPECADATIDDGGLTFEPDALCSIAWGNCEPVTYRVDGTNVVVTDGDDGESHYRVAGDRAYRVANGEVLEACWLVRR